MKKKIYAMGGGSYGKLYDSVECYDPKMQQWTALCPLKERRYTHSTLSALKEQYAILGPSRTCLSISGFGFGFILLKKLGNQHISETILRAILRSTVNVMSVTMGLPS